jgi:Zn-dependent protease with chaperone function
LHARADSRRRRPEDRVVFELQLALAAAALTAVSVSVAAASASVHREAHTAHTTVVLGTHLTYPEVNLAAGLLLGLAGLGAVVIVRVVRGLVIQARTYKRFLAEVEIVGTHDRHRDVTLFRDATPQAFCAGLFQARIFISTATVELLSDNELDAVVGHERDHRSAHDPLRLALARALSEALFFVPALHPLARQYGELAEVRADEAAIAATGGDKRSLAAALAAFDARAPDGATGISPDRVDALLGAKPVRPLPAGLIALSIATVAAVIVLAWRASGAAAANSSFNLPLLSAQPCMVVLALIPLVVWLAGRVALRQLAQRA